MSKIFQKNKNQNDLIFPMNLSKKKDSLFL